MKVKQKHTQEQSAAKAGMSIKTARKYLHTPVTKNQKSNARNYRTRIDPFAAHSDILETFLTHAPELQANTLMAYLIEQFPEQYNTNQLRTLQRWVTRWLGTYGPEKSIIFRQNIEPGCQSQSDWTCMNELEIIVAGQVFHHILFHFMLPYSGWENVTIGHSESLEELTQGYENAVWQLGGVLPEHRTDNLSAATQRFGCGRKFTLRWQEFLNHYGVCPSRNNPGESHENGSVEQSNGGLKTSLNQHLLLRGSRSFSSHEDYDFWLQSIVQRRNKGRQIRLEEELKFLRALPAKPYHAPTIIPVRVHTGSIVTILGVPYSVHSRLILSTLKAYVYPDIIELYYGDKCVQKMSRSYDEPKIDYRHIIDSLVRKPGAFAKYRYRECLFPTPAFKKLYEHLEVIYPAKAVKYYLKTLQLAKLHGEQEVLSALLLLAETNQPPLPEIIKSLLDTTIKSVIGVSVNAPSLATYDGLHAFRGVTV